MTRGKMGRRPCGPGAAAVLLAALALAPHPGAMAGEREISGSRTFAGEVVVPKGDTWRVLPGATVRFRGGKWTVRGKLLVEGTAERPVRIAGDGAFEGLDVRGGDGTVVADAVIAGGGRGARVTNGSAAFRRVRFEKCGIGLEVGRYARVTVTGCAFESPARAGVLVQRGGVAEIAGSRFAGAGKAGVYVFGARDVSVTDCRFDGNAVGLQAAMAGARPAVARCVFRENGTGLLIEKMAATAVADCEIADNRVGLAFSRRAEGRVSKSRIAGNGDGVVVEFSSYPVFRGNAFRGNRDAAVRLRHQSSEWEEEIGDSGRENVPGAGAAPFGGPPGGRGEFRPGDAGGPDGPAGAPGGSRGREPERAGTVDFRGNDWGEPAPGADGGAAAGIHDGRVEPTFDYRGKTYRMDRVLLK